MALRIRGKKGYYHAYFRTVKADHTGRMTYTTTTVNLGTTDLLTAQAMEAELMRRNEAARLHQRASAHLARLEIDAGRRPEEDAPETPTRAHRRKRLKISDALETVRKYRELGETTQKHWRRFAGDVPYTYMDELTPDLAHAYLSERYGEKAGKTYNNVKSALNAIYTLLLLDSGMPESPFARVPNRVQD